MAQVITTTQQFAVSVAFHDAKGNPAPVENIQWGSSDPALLNVQPNLQDSSKAMVYAAGAVGTGQVNMRCDSKMGEGEKELAGTLDVEVVGAEAVVAIFSTGEVTEQGPEVNPLATQQKAKPKR